MILVEHLVVVLVPLHHHLPTHSCLGQEAFERTSMAVPILWLVSNFFLVWHYKNFHTWSQTNGPLQTCLGSKDEEKTISCITGCCCHQNLFKVTLNTQNCIRYESITENTDDFKLKKLPQGNGMELITDVVNSQPLLR